MCEYVQHSGAGNLNYFSIFPKRAACRLLNTYAWHVVWFSISVFINEWDFRNILYRVALQKWTQKTYHKFPELFQVIIQFRIHFLNVKYRGVHLILEKFFGFRTHCVFVKVPVTQYSGRNHAFLIFVAIITVIVPSKVANPNHPKSQKITSQSDF